MRRFFCFVLPPMAILLCGKPFTAFFNCFLCLFGWYPGVRHAHMVVNDWYMVNNFKGIAQAISRRPQSFDHAPRRQRSLSVAKELPPPLIDDPLIGTGGTRFRRR